MIVTERGYRILKGIAVAVVLAPVAWLAYEGFVPEQEPGDMASTAGDRAFADGYYERALEEYSKALEQESDHPQALRGKARTFIEMGRPEEAVELYERYLAMEPESAGAYANRGIAYDRMGEHEQALKDYERALTLDPSVAEGPGWLTRFLHLGAEEPPTIADRADYLREQLALPEDERKLADPEQDRAQRSYSQRLE
ncbi:MAG: tetratricopeptide repeat protein [Halorhodospira sp.]